VKVEVLLERVIPVLDKAQVPYMLTGSVASSVHGMPRSTQDLDIVIAASEKQLQQIISEFQALDFYANEMQAATALVNGSQFNVMDNITGWKVDFIFAEETEYGRTALARRESIPVTGMAVHFARAEDVVIAKLRWAKQGGSERQIEDAAGIVKVRGDDLDIAYIEHWVRSLGVEEQWNTVRKSVES
jgi:hypothetical protein